MARLWAIVLAANLAGTMFAALFCTFTPALSGDVYNGMLEISRDLLAYGWWEMVFCAIAAGFLMAAMVWLMPGAEGAQFHVIMLMTWFRGVGLVADDFRLYGTGLDRQHDWRHRAVRADRLCPGDGRNLGP